jgi:hypothetical protein
MEPTPLAPVRRMAPLGVLAQVTMAAFWAAALAQIVFWLIAGVGLPWTVSITDLWENANLLVLIFFSLAILAEAVAIVLLIAWLYRARSNVDTLRDAEPEWSLMWTVVAWLIPVVNIVLPPVIIADVARCSTDEVAGRETTRQVNRVYTWWFLRVAGIVGAGAWQWWLVPTFLRAVLRYVSFDAGLVFALASPVAGVLLALAGAIVGSGMVGAISREQRQRVDRVWSGNAAEAYTSGLIG